MNSFPWIYVLISAFFRNERMKQLSAIARKPLIKTLSSTPSTLNYSFARLYRLFLLPRQTTWRGDSKSCLTFSLNVWQTTTSVDVTVGSCSHSQDTHLSFLQNELVDVHFKIPNWMFLCLKVELLIHCHPLATSHVHLLSRTRKTC